MGAPGDTGKEMRRHISDDRTAVKNMELFLYLESHSSSILEIQMQAINVLTQLLLDEHTIFHRERGENLIRKMLDIFLAQKWMENYLAEKRANVEEEKARLQVATSNLLSEHEIRKSKEAGEALLEKKMNAVQETASQLKEKAGEALAMLCMGSQRNSEAISNFTGCGDVVECLTELLDSKIKTIKCKISATETMETEIKTRCRISAAEILKHLCTHCKLDHTYVKENVLKKVLEELLHIGPLAQTSSTSTQNTSASRRNDI